jgi:hypothetical protein
MWLYAASELLYGFAVPEISRFFGIVVRMFFNDHEPPHFHVTYGEFEALIEVDTLAVYRGELPRRDWR